MSREIFETQIIRVFRVGGLVVFFAAAAFPFYWMIVSSFKPLEELLLHPENLGLDLRSLDFTSYRQVLLKHGFFRYIANSLYVSLMTVAVSVSLGTLGGYAVTRLRFPGKGIFSAGVLLVYMLPAIVLVVPLYVIFTHLGLRDSLHVLVLVYVAQTLPVSVYMLKNHFQALPPEIEYAGMVDGCSRAGVIWRVVIPLSAPALASVALYTFMIAWNEFLFAFMFLDTPDKFTLSRGIVQLAGSVHLSKQLVMAASVVVTVPVLILFLFFERQLVRGLTAGALKG
ncbi:MAG: carbohydrate ABC transporter permease [Deltaproteobacteria bacterium]|nr:carbohydrate ABC transporter permease [Deltaproteobacteria bacterium]MBW1923589.1 carbohydrate ABC transporter permease [Deltaproteobacteria bacterium]MBW1948581.1 carbohydrate ABC transporter permease [Deltaproteobacteria bacterium]MBW2006743.1 carbohydrate ABC transporter permease [Deltaproteobacteria bacterium]MBW2101668.1 carbohydrate ABC transporter permease [Deltaproteobacteria bacterium]